MPGPLLTVTVAESARIGFRAGPLLITGHAVLEFLLVIAIVLGLGPFLESPSVMAIIALFGGGMLLWMGVDMVRNSSALSLNRQETGKHGKRTPHPVLVGILASLSNPYWTLWWATIGLGYLVAAMNCGVRGVVVFFLGHIAADYAWYTLISLGISRGKRILRDRSYQIMIRICGLFLIGFGVWFFLSAREYMARAGF
ncbi:MAG: LysE family transporter [Deltaproteobacteria bacterium]|nr:LysE family transporter [Deltaproteobacteria bacterium]MBW2358596.1 LysE family transporter [Deltaproteobacteria bacterium]